jgi:antirestriction protein ArdC
MVGMPAYELFRLSEEYYATVFHELAHSTGHETRLHRQSFDSPTSFGSESYSREELIAEMTAAMLCGIAGIEQKTLENSAAYLKSWITRLKSDSRLIVSASSQAQQAADFIRGETPVRQACCPCPSPHSTAVNNESSDIFSART